MKKERNSLILLFFLDLASLLNLLGTCSFVIFWKKFHPAHLFCPARLSEFYFAWPRVRWKKPINSRASICNSYVEIHFTWYSVVFCRSFCVEFCIVFCVNWNFPILSYKLQNFSITFYFKVIKRGLFIFLRGTTSLLIYQNSRKFPPCSFILTCSFIKLKKIPPCSFIPTCSFISI